MINYLGRYLGQPGQAELIGKLRLDRRRMPGLAGPCRENRHRIPVLNPGRRGIAGVGTDVLRRF